MSVSGLHSFWVHSLVFTDFYCVQVGLNCLFAVFFSSAAYVRLFFLCVLVFVVPAGSRSIETMGTTNCLLSALEYVCCSVLGS